MDLFLVAYIYVIVFSAWGIYYGSSAKTWSKRKYIIVLSILCFLILIRLILNYVPKTELLFKDIDLYGYFSFYWLMPGMALLLTIAFHHMPRSRRAIYLGFGLLPFALFFMTIYKAYTYDYQKFIYSNQTKEGHYLQTTSFTCGPATGATVLNIFKVEITERELAVKGKTTSMTGMNEFLLKTFLNELLQKNKKQLKAIVKSYDSITAKDKKYPIIVTINYGPLMAHWIVQLSESEKGIKCFDPLKGTRIYSAKKVRELSRSHCIVFKEIQ